MIQDTAITKAGGDTLKKWVLAPSSPRKDLKEEFVLVSFFALFEGCLEAKKGAPRKRVLAIRPRTKQGTADAF